MLSASVLSGAESVVAQSSDFQLGPISMEDQFTLSLPRLTHSPESATLLSPDTVLLRSSVAVSNTINRESDSFLIDSEDRTLNLSIGYGLSEKVELRAELPVVWRGGGVFDSFIFNWHELLSLPQGPRDDRDIRDDSFSVSGEEFEFDESGLKFGDLKLSTKFVFNDITSILSLRLPTGASSFGANGVDILYGLLFQHNIGSFYLHTNLAYSFYSAPKLSGLQYSRHRAYSSIHLEYPFWNSYSLVGGLVLNSNLVQNVRHFPNYLLYLDLGLKAQLSESLQIELLTRENPAPDQGSSDFTALIALKYLL